jgi:hypothetical protein
MGGEEKRVWGGVPGTLTGRDRLQTPGSTMIRQLGAEDKGQILKNID